MQLASHLPPGDRERVEARLRSNLMFGTPERFAELFCAALIITPTRLRT
jgi:hypothetical protein